MEWLFLALVVTSFTCEGSVGRSGGGESGEASWRLRKLDSPYLISCYLQKLTFNTF